MLRGGELSPTLLFENDTLSELQLGANMLYVKCEASKHVCLRIRIRHIVERTDLVLVEWPSLAENR